MPPKNEPRTVPSGQSPMVLVGEEALSLGSLVDVAHGRARIGLHPGLACRERLRRSVDALDSLLRKDTRIYGVTTGFGESCVNKVSFEYSAALSLNLVRFHGCGTGEFLTEVEAAAVVCARLGSLARGHSAVREILIENLCEFLNRGILPRIPVEGSVGASGDLTPLSYVGAALVGEREVSFRGRILPAR